MRINVVATFEPSEWDTNPEELVKRVLSVMGTAPLEGNKAYMDYSSGRFKRLTFEVRINEV